MAGVCTPNPCQHAFALAACRADFDHSGVVNGSDLVAFVDAWLSQDGRADFDGSLSIDVQDIFAYLSAWFAGCG
jgi:hypothetical protein